MRDDYVGLTAYSWWWLLSVKFLAIDECRVNAAAIYITTTNEQLQRRNSNLDFDGLGSLIHAPFK
jgi:hypothetical protein